MSGRDEARVEARRRALGSGDPRCRVEGCGVRDPRVLTGADPDILCAEHRAAAQGRRPVERHHVAGRHNRPATVALPANLHAVLSFNQRDWPTEALRNPHDHPLLRAIASVRGSRETIAVILEEILRRTEDELLELVTDDQESRSPRENDAP